jgi:hypothetical protein
MTIWQDTLRQISGEAVAALTMDLVSRRSSDGASVFWVLLPTCRYARRGSALLQVDLSCGFLWLSMEGWATLLFGGSGVSAAGEGRLPNLTLESSVIA